MLDRRAGLAEGWGGSLLLHAAVLLIGVIGWMRWQPQPAPAPMLAIEATVVDAPIRKRSTPTPRIEKPRSSPPAAIPEPRPQPTPVATSRASSPVIATPIPNADRPLPSVQPVRAVPTEERKIEEKRLQDERALQASLLAEEKANALRNSEAAFAWRDAIAAHIMRHWRQPDSARAGLRCVVLVDQVPGGEVVSARITECNGDDAVRQSIEAAVFRAAPLPQPPETALFERRLELVFVPKD